MAADADGRAEIRRPVLAELYLPAVVLAILAFLSPRAHGLDQVVIPFAMLAVAANAAINAANSVQATERRRRADEAMADAAAAIESASRVTRTVLGHLEQDVLPAMDEVVATAEALTVDRRLSPSVRNRAAAIRTAGEGALAILNGIVSPSQPNAAAPQVVTPPQAQPQPLAVEPQTAVVVEAPPAAGAHVEAPIATAFPGFRSLEVDEDAAAIAPVIEAAPRVAAQIAVEIEPEVDVEALEAEVEPASDFRPVRPLRVLAAEHNGVHQLLLRTLLAQAGITPEIVADGVAVIEAWKREPWDLILIDAQLPEVDLVSATRMIRSAEAKAGWSYTPIVALAANASARQVTDYIAAGVDACVAKPIEATKLLSTIEAVMAAPAPGGIEMADIQMANVA